MHTGTTKPPRATTFERTYPGTRDQVRHVRADVAPFVDGSPFAYDFVLIASELSANAVLHSRSGMPGGAFTVRAEVHRGDYAWLEVEDQGGPWIVQEPHDERGRGLALVASVAGDSNWVIEDGSTPGTRVVWVRLDWHQEQPS